MLVCRYWEGTAMRNNHCGLRAAISGCHLSKALIPGSRGDLLCLSAFAKEVAWSTEAEGETTRSTGLALSS